LAFQAIAYEVTNIMATKTSTKHVETFTSDEARRKNIPSAEQQSFVQQGQTAAHPPPKTKRLRQEPLPFALI
jgi:hypothetical protein